MLSSSPFQLTWDGQLLQVFVCFTRILFEKEKVKVFKADSLSRNLLNYRRTVHLLLAPLSLQTLSVWPFGPRSDRRNDIMLQSHVDSSVKTEFLQSNEMHFSLEEN